MKIQTILQARNDMRQAENKIAEQRRTIAQLEIENERLRAQVKLLMRWLHAPRKSPRAQHLETTGA